MSSPTEESLDARIIALEDRVVRHRIRVTSDGRQLQRAFRQRIASGGAVFAAVCLGVALGRKKGGGERSVLTVLNAINVCATLLLAISPSTLPGQREPTTPNSD